MLFRSQRVRQLGGIVKVEGIGLDRAAEGIGAMGRLGERANPVARGEQLGGNVLALVAERAGDDVKFLGGHSRIRSCRRPRRLHPAADAPRTAHRAELWSSAL